MKRIRFDENVNEKFEIVPKVEIVSDASDGSSSDEVELLRCEDAEKSASCKFIDRLVELNLRVDWRPPELHTLCNHFTRLPTPEVRREIARRELPYRSGTFTPAEDEIVARNWRRLRKRFRLPDDPAALACWRSTARKHKPNAARRFAVLWLSRGLPDRMPSQVFMRFVHVFGATNKGRFSEYERELVEEFTYNNERQQTQHEFASTLGRDVVSLRRQIRLIQSEQPKIPIKWTLEKNKQLLKNMLKIVRGEDAALTGKSIKLLVGFSSWSEAGKLMNLTPLQLKLHWNRKLYMQLFSKEPIIMRQILLKLLLILHQKKYAHWQDVDWKELSNNFQCMTSAFLWRKFYDFAEKFSPSRMKRFDELVEYLYEQFVVQKHFMPKLRLLRILVSDDEELLHYFK